MSYIIEPSIARGATKDDLLNITDTVLDQAEELFEKGPLERITTLSVSAGSFLFTDGRGDLEFTDYEAKVAGSFRDTEGNRILITVDGGMLNVSSLVRGLRKAVSDARL